MPANTNSVRLYRVENPNIPADPDGIVSHEDLVGQWFTPNLGKATIYLRKATQTFGRESHVVDGARLVVTEVPAAELEPLHVSRHPIASTMDVEPDNYIVPPELGYPTTALPLDEQIGDFRGHMTIDNRLEAERRVYELAEKLGDVAVQQTQRRQLAACLLTKWGVA